MDYDTILLSQFFDVSRSGDLSVLGYATRRENMLAWEKIVSRNAKENGAQGLFNYRQQLVQLNLLRADYLLVKGAITKLNFVVDNEAISFLNKKGYRISTSGAVSYADSLLAANRASDNYLSKIESRQKALDKLVEKGDEGPTFQSVLASLSIALGFNVPETVKLAWFNEAKKSILKQKSNGRG